MLLILLLACPGKDDTPDSLPEESPWSMLAEGVEGGALLSAWSDGDTALMVGGDLGGGPAMLARYDGETLCVEEPPAEHSLWWIHGPREGEWYAVGESGVVIHSVDGERSREDLDSEATLFGVWATEDEVWAVGGVVAEGAGDFWRRTDGEWEAVRTGLDGLVFKVWDGFFVGDGLSFHLVDGELVELEQDQRLLTVRGRAEDDVWAVGGSGGSIIRRFDGTAWEDIDTTGLGQPLSGVWTAPDEEVWVAGNFGTTAVGGEDGWEGPDLPLTTDHFHAAWKHGEEVLFGGGDLFSPSGNHATIARWSEDPAEVSVTDCE